MKVDYSSVVMIGSLTLCGTYMVLDIASNVTKSLNSKPVAESTLPPEPLAGIKFTRTEPEPVLVQEPTIEDLYAAIRWVESNNNSSAVGDNGNAIGCYQIWENYWIDALKYSGLGGSYSDCFDCDYAHQIVLAYMDRYATEERLGRPVTFEDIARIHNGGPNGHRKESTKKYWKKVEARLYR